MLVQYAKAISQKVLTWKFKIKLKLKTIELTRYRFPHQMDVLTDFWHVYLLVKSLESLNEFCDVYFVRWQKTT